MASNLCCMRWHSSREPYRNESVSGDSSMKYTCMILHVRRNQCSMPRILYSSRRASQVFITRALQTLGPRPQQLDVSLDLKPSALDPFGSRPRGRAGRVLPRGWPGPLEPAHSCRATDCKSVAAATICVVFALSAHSKQTRLRNLVRRSTSNAQ